MFDLGAMDEHQALRLLERQAAILRGRQKLIEFTKFTMPDATDPDDATRTTYDAQPFHEAIGSALDTFRQSVGSQLIFAMPPRHGKSELVSKRLVAMLHGLRPEWHIAVAMYNDDIAFDIGSEVRDILQSSSFKQLFPNYRLKKGGAAKNNLYSMAGGRIRFVGRGGSLTGRGCSVLVVDDLYKDYEEARSPVIREQAWNWFTKVAMTRRMHPKLVILVGTRWHSDDLVGRLTDPENPNFSEANAKRWQIIRLPMLAEQDDVLERPIGKPLWPERFDEQFAAEQRDLDPLGFASLYQQRPTVEEGTLFKAENIVWYNPSELPDVLRFYGASDHAVGLKQRNDLSCLLKAGLCRDNNLWLTNCIWDRIPSNVLVEYMIDLFSDNQPPLVWWAEKDHISKSIGPFLLQRMAERNVYQNIIDMTPAVDIVQRAQAIAGRVAQRKVRFPRGEPWAERAVSQLLAFPNGTHDDFVAALCWLGIGLRDLYVPSTPEKPKEEPKFGTLDWVKRMDAWQRERELVDAADAY